MNKNHEKMKRQSSIAVLPRIILVVIVAMVLAPVAYAHVGVGQTTSFAHGFIHPLSGFDHVLAMMSVGLWAAQRGARARWLIPVTFLIIMAVGGVAGSLGITVPFLEQGIALSVLVLGVLVAAAVRWPLPLSMLIVGVFALFHGHSHGAEMPLGVSGLEYGAGFVLATSLLHAVGAGAGILFHSFNRDFLTRLLGSAVAASGVYLLLTV
jgi:urease accessory protein